MFNIPTGGIADLSYQVLIGICWGLVLLVSFLTWIVSKLLSKVRNACDAITLIEEALNTILTTTEKINDIIVRLDIRTEHQSRNYMDADNESKRKHKKYDDIKSQLKDLLNEIEDQD